MVGDYTILVDHQSMGGSHPQGAQQLRRLQQTGLLKLTDAWEKYRVLVVYTNIIYIYRYLIYV